MAGCIFKNSAVNWETAHTSIPCIWAFIDKKVLQTCIQDSDLNPERSHGTLLRSACYCYHLFFAVPLVKRQINLRFSADHFVLMQRRTVSMKSFDYSQVRRQHSSTNKKHQHTCRPHRTRRNQFAHRDCSSVSSSIALSTCTSSA